MITKLTKPLPETIIFFTLCTIDLISTIFLVRHGLAKEANPVLKWAYNYGDFYFCFVKFFTYSVPLSIIETIKSEKNINTIRWILRIGIFAYLLNYGVLSYIVNK
jgi:hypothetical protein